MTIQELNTRGHELWELRESAKSAMSHSGAEEDDAYGAWSIAADDLADAARELASEVGIGVEDLRAKLDVHARDAFREPAF